MKNIIDVEEVKRFMNNMPMAIINREGKYVFVSNAWEKLIGISADKAISKFAWNIVPDTHVKEAMKTGKHLVAKTVFNKDGIPLITNYIPIKEKNGEIKGCYLYALCVGMNEAQIHAQEINRLSNQLKYYKSELSRERGTKYNIDSIIGNSFLIKEMKNQIISAARTNSTVLIEGETGTGKELIAHAIHSLSSRCSANFVRVNCAAIPIELMESEFFGYKGGSFTGANRNGKVGRFELANKGSIFFDEINTLSPLIQPKLLRVLEEKEIDPIGGDKSIPIDVRIISASNYPLAKLVEEKKFREDLYYRLNVIKIVAPPLRERKEDIPILAVHLLQQLNHELSMMITSIDSNAMQILMKYDWPGNIRELRNVIESAMNKTNDFILKVSDFEKLLKPEFKKLNNKFISRSFNLKKSQENLEYDIICATLKHTDGNKTNAAKLLGISRTVLYDKLRKYGIVYK